MAAVVLHASPAGANDSVGHIAAGGLILGRTDAIEMIAEDLFISAREVRVNYRFLNRTDANVTTIVAFPMPEVTAPSEANNFVVPNPQDSSNFMDFQTTVDGRRVDMQSEQKAFAVGIDRTTLLSRLSLPVSPLSQGLPERLATLPQATLDQLRTLGMVESGTFDIGQGVQRHVQPLWSVRTIYYWEQTFPAGRELTVEHRYKPSVGGSAQTIVGAPYANDAALKDYRTRYCMTEDFIRAAQHLRKPRKGQDQDEAIVGEDRLEYVLTTGANWAGSIREFRLTVDKGSVRNLVSFCMDGVKKISPTQFLVEKRDFYPERNLEVLILRPVEMP